MAFVHLSSTRNSWRNVASATKQRCTTTSNLYEFVAAHATRIGGRRTLHYVKGTMVGREQASSVRNVRWSSSIERSSVASLLRQQRRSTRWPTNALRRMSTQHKDGKRPNEATSFWQRWTAQHEMPPRNTPAWYREMVLVCTVFAITGTSTMVIVRPAVSSLLGLKGSLRDGPWSYRLCSLVIMTPLYATLLVVVGTVFGRHVYFRHFSVKMFSRFGVPPEAMDPTFHQTAKTFRKW